MLQDKVHLLNIICQGGIILMRTSGTSSLCNRVLEVLPCWRLSLIWHTKVQAKSDWSVKHDVKPGHKTITPFGVKVMSKFKVLSKREHGVIKKEVWYLFINVLLDHNLVAETWSLRPMGVTWKYKPASKCWLNVIGFLW